MRVPRKLIVVAGLCWIAMLASGFYVLAREEFTPAAIGSVGARFPAHSALALAPEVPTLILFVHPHCPCTRASLHALAEMMASLPQKLDVTIVFTLPPGVAADWEQGDLWQSAVALPGARVFTDRDGREAGRFGVKASGHVLLYQPSGELAFSGGITPSRGHEGDNLGRAAVTSQVLAGHALVDRAPVYGCPLLEPPAPALQP